MKLQRLHAPLGRRFTKNAEALADLALEVPMLAPDMFTLHAVRLPEDADDDDRSGKAQLRHRDFTVVGHVHDDGCIHDSRLFVTQFIANLATIVGAPVAPNMLLSDAPDDLYCFSAYAHASRAPRAIKREEQPDYECEIYREWPDPRDNPVSLAAAGQFRAWINEMDQWNANVSVCGETQNIYLFDHAFCETDYGSTRMTVTRQNKTFIRKIACRLPNASRAPYMDAAAEMARRIHTLDAGVIGAVADGLHAYGIKVNKDYVNYLTARRSLFEQPVCLNKMPASTPEPR